MKVLIVDVNFDYKNPMYRQFYTNLSYCMEVDYFGPGYVERSILEDGLQKFINQKEKYDAIIVGTYFIYSAYEGMKYDTYTVHRYVIPYYFVNDAYQCCRNIINEIIDLTGVIKIVNYYEDFCFLSKQEYHIIKILMEKGFYLLSWPLEYMEEYSYKARKKFTNLTNYAIELAQNKKYYIPISMHAISYNEIFMCDYSYRKYDWCVPGNKMEKYYPEREHALTVMKGQQKKIWNYDPYQKLSVGTIERNNMKWYQFRNDFEKMVTFFEGKNKYISSFPKTIYIAACRENYLDSMRKSKKVYVDGGIGDCMVRKYFESCACGALTVMKNIPGLKQMGFVDGENCILIKDYKELQILDKQLCDDRRNEQIAKNGQKLVLDRHMFHHRAESLYRTIETIKRGVYKGAIWENGNYIVIE